jgi:hypothetical protein
MELINHKNLKMPKRMLSPNARNKKFSSASKVVRLLFAQRFITIFNCCYHTSNHLSVCHKPTSLSPINCQSVSPLLFQARKLIPAVFGLGAYLLTLPLFAGISRVKALSPAWTGSHAREILISRTHLFLDV